jgi:hypothetical protein
MKKKKKTLIFCEFFKVVVSLHSFGDVVSANESTNCKRIEGISTFIITIIFIFLLFEFLEGKD